MIENYPQHKRRQIVVCTSLGLVLVLLVAALASMFISAPYVIDSPGPTYNVLGTQGDTQIIEISDLDGNSLSVNNDSDAELRMVTVSEQGGPGYSVSYWQVFLALFDSSAEVLPYDEVYSQDVTAEQVDQAGKAQLAASETAAEVAALEYLGYEVPGTLTITGVVDGSGAAEVLQADDILREIEVDEETYELDDLSTLYDVLEDVEVGQEVEVTVERDGDLVTVPVVTIGNSSGNTKLGIYVSAEADLPVDISITLEKVGGSSAGMMFALGIIDKMTEDGIVSDTVIAGTGSLSYNGSVLAIGGIVQKMYGALRDGAEYFLAPAGNCSEVIGNVPSGLSVFAVEDLEEAVEAVQAISAGDTGGLTTCEAVVSAQSEEE